jgi:hypothetical protein
VTVCDEHCNNGEKFLGHLTITFLRKQFSFTVLSVTLLCVGWEGNYLEGGNCGLIEVLSSYLHWRLRETMKSLGY